MNSKWGRKDLILKCFETMQSVGASSGSRYQNIARIHDSQAQNMVLFPAGRVYSVQIFANWSRAICSQLFLSRGEAPQLVSSGRRACHLRIIWFSRHLSAEMRAVAPAADTGWAGRRGGC
jgi:hypothetical protein